MAGATEGGEGEAFARTLSALKERGSNLLVVGTAHEEGHLPACERLFGEDTAGRRRLLVRTDGDCGTAPSDGEGTTSLVEFRSRWLNGGAAVDGVPRQRVDGVSIDELEEAVLGELETLADAGERPDPGELRLCVDSLRPLLAEHSPGRVRRFVDRLAGRVAGVKGMGHFHLPAPSDDRHVPMLTSAVDAVVEVRVRHGEPQQRWHVFEGAVDSGWLPL